VHLQPKPNKNAQHQMKSPIKNLTTLVLGLTLAAISVSAGAYNLAVSASNGTSDSNGGDPWLVSVAGVGWYAYSYGPAGAYVSISGNGINVYQSAPSNGSASGSDETTSAGQLQIRMGCQTSPGGSAGAGVTVNW
jgi:hypothetical protein